MLQIHTLPLGAYQTNTYIVYEEGSNSCAIIDPGYEAKVILNKVSQLGLTVDAILLTHGHFDHVGAVEKILSVTGCELWMHKADFTRPGDAINRYLYPLSGSKTADILFYSEGDKVIAGNLSFTVLSTPGHTPGSVCYMFDGMLFTGDTLFKRSIGRTDLGGDEAQMMRSLRALRNLPGDYDVYPGHDAPTTLEDERECNPYLKRI